MSVMYATDREDDKVDELIMDYILMDDKHRFVEEMNYIYGGPIRKNNIDKEEVEDDEDLLEPAICPPEVLESVIRNSAIGCATALLEGESGFVARVNDHFRYGHSPLLSAAGNMLYETIGLLLRHGADVNIKSIETNMVRGGLLPLNVSLEMLNYHGYMIDWWTPKYNSILKLIVLLCLPQMKTPLDIIRLLASDTKRVDDIFHNYAMEGKLIEMAALLIVAWEKVMPRFEASMGLVLGDRPSMNNDSAKVMGRCFCKNHRLIRVFKDKEMVMWSALELFNVFARAGDCIGEYLRSVKNEMEVEEVVRDIVLLLKGAGFALNDTDTDLSNIRISPYYERQNFFWGNVLFKPSYRRIDEKTIIKISFSCANQLRDHGMGLHSQSGGILWAQNQFLVTNKTNEPMSGLPYRACHIHERTVIKPLQDFLSAKTFSRFGLLIKRGMWRL